MSVPFDAFMEKDLGIAVESNLYLWHYKAAYSDFTTRQLPKSQP